MNKGRARLAALFFFITALLISSCGGGSGGGTITPPPPVTIAISPTAASVVAGGTQQFTATVTGPSNTSVSWSVNNAPGGNATVGTISATGLYAAPATVPNPATVSVTATSQADATKSASATVTITPAPMPTASFQPTSLDFGSVNVTSNISKTVTLTNSGNAVLTITNIAVTDTGDFSETNVCGTSLAAGKSCNIVVSFAPTASGARTASLAVTDNASGSPQSVPLSGTGVVTPLTISPTSATVLLGGTMPFSLNVNATANSALFGNMPVTSSGSTFTAAYTVPQALPSAWNDTLTGTATVGGSQASAQITLQYPVPTITGTADQGVSLGTLWGIQPSGGPFAINGSGFLSDGTLNVLNDRFDICGVAQVNWTQMVVGIALSYVDFGVQCNAGNPQSSWDPGFIGFTVSDPATGHGGGTSNVGRLAFIGDQNLMACNATDCFFIDSATSTVRKFKIADGSPDGSFTFTPGTGLAIAIDDVTGEVVVFTDTSTEAFDPVTNAKVYEEDAASPGALHGGAAGGGWAMLSAYNGDAFPGVMDAINLQQPGNPPVHVSYGFGSPQYAPWNFQITTLNGKPTEVVWSAYAGILSTVDIATQNVLSSVTLPNIFTFSYTGYFARGGWQLETFNSGPLAGEAVLLSNFDQLLVYVNLATMTEIRRVDLTAPFKSANPPLPELQSFRIGKDEADGSIIVAFADSVNGKTVLYNVDANGNMTPLGATQSFLATGLQESTDGTQIYWGNRSSFAIAPKQ